MALEQCSEGIARKLASLVGVEYCRCSPAVHRLLDCIHAKLHIHGVGQLDLTAIPIDHGTQIQPALWHV